jgi:6-phosphogluconolactonase
MVFEASLIVSPTKADVPAYLNPAIVEICKDAIAARGVFTIALSGGSLPGFLAVMKESFGSIDPKFDCWHVILADERCVESTHPDSNLGALKEQLFSKIPVPASQIYGINESKIAESSAAVAADYEPIVKWVLAKSGGQLDLAVLGFGPDGHTCSLFPGHPLLQEETLLVAPIEDSPKPPPKRITLTYPVLNTMTRHVIFCGAGGSKAAILKEIFVSVTKEQEAASKYKVVMTEPYPYPCANVLPNSEGVENTLTYVVDQDAMDGVAITEA